MNVALIFAGGVGKRMNSKGKPKQFLELNGKPIIIHTVEHFETHKQIDSIVIVCVAEWIEYLENLLKKFNIRKVVKIVEGGLTAQESTRRGLYAIEDIYSDKIKETIVLIHDGVRPLINEQLITDNIDTVKKYGNAITVVPAIETIISVNSNDEIQNVMERSKCRLARAPQSFWLKDILMAQKKAQKDQLSEIIDSASLMKYYGITLHTVEGPIENIKITSPSDFYIFRAIVEAKENSQIWGLQ